jgi:hypothetical protein
MSYIINKTDGSVLTEVVDGTIDQISTDLTLVGKNATTYGELFNENFIKLLENFANTTQPNFPLEGQLWYDTIEGRLKVYDGSGFKVSGGTIVSSVLPSSIAPGDIWINSSTQQLYFNDGSANVLAGPLYTSQQGVSGFQVRTVLDTNNITRTILELYVGQILVGIYSTATFIPLNDIPGYSPSNVKVGFNSAYSEIVLNSAASQAVSLIAADGSTKTAESFLQVAPSEGYTVSTGTIRILNDQPLILGSSQNTEVKYTSNSLQINSNIANQNFEINSINSEGLLPSLFINAQNKWVGLYTSSPTTTLDVNGGVRVRGDLTVEGNTTTINTTNLAVKDLLIELGKVDSPSNSTAAGGGILLEAGADGDKTLTWETISEAWTSSENIDLATDKAYKINNFEVLSQTQLGSTVASAPGLNSIGQLNQLAVDNININNETISFVNISVPDGSIILQPKGSGTVDVSSKRISSLAAPVDNTDAVNFITLKTTARSVPLGFSANFTPYITEENPEQFFASNVLAKIFPPGDHDENTFLRVWCIDITVAKEYRLISDSWVYQSDI